MIHTNSKFIARKFSIDYYTTQPSGQQLEIMQNYVVCKTAFDLLNSPMLSRGSNSSKSLGDFSIKYYGGNSDDGIDEVLDQLKSCYKRNMSIDGLYKSSVKSMSDRYYPGRNTRHL